MRHLFTLRLYVPLSVFFFYACTSNCPPTEVSFNHDRINQEVTDMLHAYSAAIAENGLKSEFTYLDSSENFFWVPPGFSAALDYDSVKTILLINDQGLQKSIFTWEKLIVYPLSAELATYTGIVKGHSIDTSGQEMNYRLIETGTVKKSSDGWKLLSGQTNLMPE